MQYVKEVRKGGRGWLVSFNKTFRRAHRFSCIILTFARTKAQSVILDNPFVNVAARFLCTNILNRNTVFLANHISKTQKS